MSYKKNAVSYGIWALYLMGIGIVLSFMGMVVGGRIQVSPIWRLSFWRWSSGCFFWCIMLPKSWWTTYRSGR